ncbi:helix-turn-helix domain-containing protein [Pseudomonas sp. J452]|uniref:helix-turn-helix domain-containing protein n=1 Tax=Pseudomonas sp. J452 TaxID=2898441 RepID=UPI0021AD756E|nr:helix-turn-helix transcriptional regulator [Pseudomonas sp. J452]UUY07701.1 helix-turn-helix domain-containing protein [Pseudomonas sp. J452]
MSVSERGVFLGAFEAALATGELTDFGAAVRSLRSCTGFGQRRFAAMLKLPLETLRAIESNQSTPDVLTLNRILFPFGFQTGITRFIRSTHSNPEAYLEAGLMANHREKYP